MQIQSNHKHKRVVKDKRWDKPVTYEVVNITLTYSLTSVDIPFQ